MSDRRIAIYLLIIVGLLAGLGTGKTAFFSLAYLLGSLFIAAMVWAWLAVRRISIGRQTTSRRAHVGGVVSESFAVQNRGFLPKLWMEVRDHSDLPNHRASQVIALLRPKRTHNWQVQTMCQVRGEFTLGPMTLISGDPFGLFLHERRIHASERILVYPVVYPVTNFALPGGLYSGGEAQRQWTQQVTTNAAGVREYAQGDSINRIHWKSTARRGKLIVKEFELDPMVDIWLLADFSAESVVEDKTVRRLGGVGTVIPSGSALPNSTEEYMVAAAASLATYFTDQERALGFAAYLPQREFQPPERSPRRLTRVMETLAMARSHATMTLYDMLVNEGRSFSRGATLVILTSTTDVRWVQEAFVLARRGIRPTVVYIDPATFGSKQPSGEVLKTLEMARIPTVVVRKGDPIGSTLSQRPQ
jgi:uncharacterized protein (DUF58 family)